ncbi:16S rRNA (guanine(527)-N(7))-methyltransferase RsmG [Halomonas halocynthiae]|uniref:16S rRNA (guanine(527)-N(7))-methyltransferase RsmG n=1 Tax=Halomonas halocynthiae TaxID=176290 RepID=UPI00040E6802|nr:16S rRNA (guanine(527)-N(7))-methyltransferase RsmG [Halomonas halocynthiae]
MNSDNKGIEKRLDQGVAQLGLALDDQQRDKLLGLVNLLHKWNRAYNLTAVRDPLTMVSRHLLDSAAVAPFVTGPSVLDVGSGPGLPGLVLAILNPLLNVTLIDSNGKKVRFQRQAVMELGLTNVTPVQARVEGQKTLDGQFDQVISRAFASLPDFISLSQAWLAKDGQWLAMKGPAVDDELEGLAADVRVVDRHRLIVPFEEGHRWLVVLEQH